MKYYIDNNGNYLGGSDGTPLSANEVPFAPDNATYIWNGAYYDVPKAAVETNRISDIKNEAQKRIVSQLPSGAPDNFIIKQMNLLMLNAELDDVVINGGTLTAAQQAQKGAFIALKNKVKDIRYMSNLAETNGDLISKFNSDLDAKGY